MFHLHWTPSSQNFINVFLVLCLLLLFFFVMLQVLRDRLCNQPSEGGLFLSVKVIFLFGLMVTYPFLSLLVDVRPGYCFSTLTNGRCGNQLPQPLSKMQCCCDSGRCWSSTAASAPEMCPIRSTGMNPPVFLWLWSSTELGSHFLLSVMFSLQHCTE